jgi:hypothetical protein
MLWFSSIHFIVSVADVGTCCAEGTCKTIPAVQNNFMIRLLSEYANHALIASSGIDISSSTCSVHARYELKGCGDNERVCKYQYAVDCMTKDVWMDCFQSCSYYCTDLNNYTGGVNNAYAYKSLKEGKMTFPCQFSITGLSKTPEVRFFFDTNSKAGSYAKSCADGTSNCILDNGDNKANCGEECCPDPVVDPAETPKPPVDPAPQSTPTASAKETFAPSLTATFDPSVTQTLAPSPTATLEVSATFEASAGYSPFPTITFALSPEETVKLSPTFAQSQEETLYPSATFALTPTDTLQPSTTFDSTPADTLKPTATFASTTEATVKSSATFKATPASTPAQSPAETPAETAILAPPPDLNAQEGGLDEPEDDNNAMMYGLLAADLLLATVGTILFFIFMKKDDEPLLPDEMAEEIVMNLFDEDPTAITNNNPLWNAGLMG